MKIKAWHVQEDGTLVPVTVVGRLVWPGSVRIRLEDGSETGVQRTSLVSHQTGERLTNAELLEHR